MATQFSSTEWQTYASKTQAQNMVVRPTLMAQNGKLRMKNLQEI